MKIKNMLYAAMFAAIVAVLGLMPPIPLPFIPVPITLQTMGVMLAGSFLGKRLGFISMLLVVVIVLLGVPILSGGTGLYVQSLLENYNFNDIKPNIELRTELDKLYIEQGIEGLRQRASKLAEKGGIEIRFTDKHRLYRAIELMCAGDYNALTNQTKEGLSYVGPVIGLQRERSDLYNRINRRVEIMFEKGLVDEVISLINNGVNPDCQAFKGIGYKEVVQYLEGLISYDACIALIQKNTRHFAKRQITWYKRMPYINWITIDSNTTEIEIYNLARTMIDTSL